MTDIVATARPAFVLLVLFSLICGGAYPLLVTVAAPAIPHPEPAELVGQPFTAPDHFWSRPSAIGYAAMASSGANLGPTNPALAEAIHGRVEALRALDPGNDAPIPVDLVTASSSGLDPDISPAAAYYQVPRVARRRHLDEAAVEALVDAHVQERTFGVLGERRVNVRALNRALEQLGGP